MKIKVALDWTPNTLHAGLLLAEANHYFGDELEVEFVSPAEDNYSATPAQKLAKKEVHIAIAPAESVISYNTLGDKSVSLVAIATMFQADTSAIVTLQESGIERPAQLEGKNIGSYGARFEDDIVRQLIIKDGGTGTFHAKNPDKLDMWQNLTNRSIDAAWIFLPWEGIRARQEGIAFNAFQLKDYGIPYGYSPLLITHQDFIREQNDVLRAFLKAVEEGWRHVYDNPKKAAVQLKKYINQADFEDEDMLTQSLEMLKPVLFNSDSQWGFMEGYHWVDFVEWMVAHQVLKDHKGIPMNQGQIDSSMLYTNDFFKM